MSNPLPPFSLGPLSGLIGRWRGPGHDVAFLPGNIKVESDYVEDTVVEPTGVLRITNDLIAHAASYSSRLVHATSGEAIHQEFGYWIWIPATSEICRTVALGRCMGVVAVGQVDPTSPQIPVQFSVSANADSSPPSIAIAHLKLSMPEMVGFSCNVSLDANSFSYDQVTKVVFSPGAAAQDHTDKARLIRQP